MKITLHRTATEWVAWFHDAQEIQELFGTNVLPTAYTAGADGEMVRARIQQLNPTDTVTISNGSL